MAGVKPDRIGGAAGAALLGVWILLMPAVARALPWAVYYSDQAPLAALDPYELLVLDSEHHPPLRPLLDRGKTVLGYLSLGEVENHRPWFARVKAMGVLAGENQTWSGSFSIDVRDRRWTALVIEELLPRLLHQGFHGVFLDTLDNPAELERQDPARHAGMTQAAARLVQAIRLHYPGIRIMLNRAYEILPEVAGLLDYELGESIYTRWDFKQSRAGLQTEADYADQVRSLLDARSRNPKLQILTLDYWDVADQPGVRAIYRLQRANGFSPYVSVVSLDRIVPEPPPPP
jgi:uncharacterized protein (TIGR01370 family)